MKELPAYILCIDTSTTCCSVGIASAAGDCIALVEHHHPQAHIRLLPEVFVQLLAQADIPKEALVAVALSAGPGSFTGLRVGAATAKGLCHGLGLPLIVCPMLQVIAAAFAPGLPKGSYLLPVLPQKGNTYAYALYEQDMHVHLPAQMSPLQVTDWLVQQPQVDALYILGGDTKVFTSLRAVLPTQTRVHRLPVRSSASYMAAHAQAAYVAKRFVTLDAFMPDYPSGRWGKGGGSQVSAIAAHIPTLCALNVLF